MKIAERFCKNATKLAMMLVFGLVMALMPNININCNDGADKKSDIYTYVCYSKANASISYVTSQKKKEEKPKKKTSVDDDVGIIRLGAQTRKPNSAIDDGYELLTSVDINQLFGSKAYENVVYDMGYGSENVLTLDRINGKLSQFALKNERGCINLLMTRIKSGMYIVVDSKRGIDFFNYGFNSYGNILIRARADFDLVIDNVDPNTVFTKKEQEVIAQFIHKDDESIISVIRVWQKLKEMELKDGKMQVTSTPSIQINTTSKTNDTLTSISTGFSIFSQASNALKTINNWIHGKL